MAGIGRDVRLTTQRLVLRPTEAADAARFGEIQANWKVTRMLRLAPWPPDPMVMAEWVAGHALEWAEGTGYRFAVELEGRVIGCVDLDQEPGTPGDLGYWLDEACWGRGYASEAAVAVVGFGFGALGLPRLTAGHAADNPGSGRTLEKLGFREVAVGERWSGPRGETIPYRFLELIRPGVRNG